jgi:hypothetical protein
MNDFVNNLKRFFRNKNTVTIIGVIAVLALLYWGYSSQVTNAVTPTAVPVAAKTIQPRTQITADMITTMEVPNIAVVENIYTNSNIIIGMYSNVNTVIPKGSMFYKEALITKSQLPDSAFFEIADNEIPYMFPVTLETTYGNSIYPGSKIDIYMKAEDTDNKVMFGKLLSDVTVVAVKDSSGNDVFEDSSEDRSPAYLIFGLSDEIHVLLRKASYLSGVDLIPVPHGGTVASGGETRVSTEYLKEYINSKTIVLEGQEGTSTETGDNTTGTNDNKKTTTDKTTGTDKTNTTKQ